MSDIPHDLDINSDEVDLYRTREKYEFYKDLSRHLKARKQAITRLPILGKKDLDLHALYAAVVKAGGLDKVVDEKLWQSKIRSNIPKLPDSCTNAAYALRVNYLKFLYSYEREKKGIEDKGENWSKLHSSVTTPNPRFGGGGRSSGGGASRRPASPSPPRQKRVPPPLTTFPSLTEYVSSLPLDQAPEHEHEGEWEKFVCCANCGKVQIITNQISKQIKERRKGWEQQNFLCYRTWWNEDEMTCLIDQLNKRRKLGLNKDVESRANHLLDADLIASLATSEWGEKMLTRCVSLINECEFQTNKQTDDELNGKLKKEVNYSAFFSEKLDKLENEFVSLVPSYGEKIQIFKDEEMAPVENKEENKAVNPEDWKVNTTQVIDAAYTCFPASYFRSIAHRTGKPINDTLIEENCENSENWSLFISKLGADKVDSAIFMERVKPTLKIFLTSLQKVQKSKGKK